MNCGQAQVNINQKEERRLDVEQKSIGEQLAVANKKLQYEDISEQELEEENDGYCHEEEFIDPGWHMMTPEDEVSFKIFLELKNLYSHVK